MTKILCLRRGYLQTREGQTGPLLLWFINIPAGGSHIAPQHGAPQRGHSG